MQKSINKIDGAIAATLLFWIAWIIFFQNNESSVSLFTTAVALLTFGIRSKRQGIAFNRNVLLFVATIIYLILFSYYAMFALIEVKPYLSFASQTDRNFVVGWGVIFLYFMLLGGFASLAITSPSKTVYCAESSQRVQVSANVLFMLAWLSLAVIAITYFLYFHGKAYVEIHTSSSSISGILLKLIYIPYGAVINIGILCDFDKKNKIRMAYLSIAFIVIYGALYNVRSPLLFYLLLIFYFYGGNISRWKLLFLLGATILAFLSIALFRDSSLSADGSFIASIQMLLNLGDFADTMIYARDLIESKGPLFGWGIAGSLFGFLEPLANDYARGVSPDYFEEGGGFGFFVLSDVIANFGLELGAFFMFLLGMGWLTFQLKARKYLPSVFIAVIYANVFAIARNDMGSTLRGCFYTVIATLVVRGVMSILVKTSATYGLAKQANRVG